MSNYSDSIKKIESSYQEPVSTKKRSASVIMPPPNITGNPHIGHIRNWVEQDAHIRYSCLNGKEIDWIPGTDHAGIATQLLVKNKLGPAASNINRDTLLFEIWKWKDEYEKSTIEQIKKMHLKLSWDKYRFSMDETAHKAVHEAFFLLHQKGLVFRDKRMVNWDISLNSVISDIETTNSEEDGTLWHIEYISDDLQSKITVATTRPETIFADEAILVHPDDIRYKDLIGEKFKVPLKENKSIPLISDSRCSIDKGTGAVKIDPAHGFLDFEIATSYHLPIQSIIDKQGKMCGNVPDWVAGMDRFEARKLVVQRLKDLNLIKQQEEIKHIIPRGTRSNSILEPMVTEQWFMDMPKLADKAKQILENGRLKIYPERFKNVYLRHLSELNPWCISRQIVWGHRIPVWYDNKNGNHYVARSKEEAIKLSGDSQIHQEEDVLDTWFSSALWPFLTQSWPDALDLKLYPNEFLVTGSDILFFWVTKMILMHLALIDENTSPFKNVILHGLVLDETGNKMSKSKGNTVDPMALLEQYGRDVLSFSLISSAPLGQNVKLSKQNLEKSQKFLNKIWNAFQFCLSNHSAQKTAIQHQANQWIIHEIQKLKNEVKQHMEAYDIYTTTNKIYDFFWDTFCSWYLEVSKQLLQGDFAAETKFTIHISSKILLSLLYPFIPILAEYLFKELTSERTILEAKNTELDIKYNSQIEEFGELLNLINQIRSIKANCLVKSWASITINKELEQTQSDIIKNLTKLNIEYSYTKDNKDYFYFSSGGILLGFPKDQINSNETIEKVFAQILDRIVREIDLLEGRLADEGFVKHASKTDLEAKRNRLVELKLDLTLYSAAQEDLISI